MPLLSPKLMPLLSPKTMLARLELWVPALKLIDAPAAAVATLAVMMPPAEVPKVTLLALEKLRVWNVNEPLDAEAA